MAKICYEIHEWLEKEIEQPVDRWLEKTKKKCKKRSWWNPLKWFCWLATTFVKIIVWIVVTVSKWITRIICEIVSLIFTLVKEIVWRSLSFADMFGTILGIRPQKYMRIKVFILSSERTKAPIIDINKVQEWVDFTIETYKKEMNVRVKAADFRGANKIIEVIKNPVPDKLLNINGGLATFFAESTGFITSLQRYTRKSILDYVFDKIGYGEPLYIYIVKSIGGGGTSGLAYPMGNIVFLSLSANMRTMPHEIGHMCLLAHHTNKKNLMYGKKNNVKGEITRLQSAWARGSKFITLN